MVFSNSTDREVRDKLTLIYILNQFGMPLNHNQITEFVMSLDLMNYFTTGQYLTEMKESGLIDTLVSRGTQLFLVTNDGQRTLEMFLGRLPASIHEEIQSAVEIAKAKIAKERQIKAGYKRISENEFSIHLEMLEGGKHLMDLKFMVFSQSRAKVLCSSWRENAPQLYAQLIDTLSGPLT